MLTLGEGDGDCAHPAVTAIWIRDAAGTWAAAPFDPLLCAGGIAQAATAGDHAVILGTGAGDVAFAWSSDDGLKWTYRSAPLKAACLRASPRRIRLRRLRCRSLRGRPGRHGAPTESWEQRSPCRAGGRSIIGNPVVLDGEIAVFVGDPSGAIGVLRPDGNGGWKSEQTSGLTRDTLARIVAVGDGLVALGGDQSGARAWISADGVTWRPLELPAEVTAGGPDAALNGAAIVDGRAYLVGQVANSGGAGGAVGALWSGPASLLTP